MAVRVTWKAEEMETPKVVVRVRKMVAVTGRQKEAATAMAESVVGGEGDQQDARAMAAAMVMLAAVRVRSRAEEMGALAAVVPVARAVLAVELAGTRPSWTAQQTQCCDRHRGRCR